MFTVHTADLLSLVYSNVISIAGDSIVNKVIFLCLGANIYIFHVHRYIFS